MFLVADADVVQHLSYTSSIQWKLTVNVKPSNITSTS